MRLYLDTADPQAIDHYLGTGLFAGVTSNPVILRAAGLGPQTAQEFHRRARAAGAREIFLQSFGSTRAAIVEQGVRYRDLGDDVVVKVVASATGLAAAAELRRAGVPVLVTAVHAAKQVLTAMAADATYVTPYLSEMNAAGRDGLAEMSTVQRVLRAAGSSTQLLLAGVADTATLVRFAEEGVPCVTITPALAEALLRDEPTEAMQRRFDEVSA